MVYIEFFDKNHIENICSSLSCLPDKVYLFGAAKKELEKAVGNYQKLFLAREQSVEFIPVSIDHNKLEVITDKLSEIVEHEEECCIDLTGGEELFLVATGIVFGKYPDKNIQMHRFNIRNNNIYDCDCDGNTITTVPVPQLSVEENISLYGGHIIRESENGGYTHIWNMNEELSNDIRLLWGITQSDKGKVPWNIQISFLQFIESRGIKLNDLSFSLPIENCKDFLKGNFILNNFLNNSIVAQLKKHELATLKSDDKQVTVTYKNEQIKRIMSKSGQVFEMYVYLLMYEAFDDKSYKKMYNDVLTGVFINWQDVDRNGYAPINVTNEIDVVAMHNMTPVFISCKNGSVNADELYKLNAVANKFGGKYAKKVLVVTSLTDDDASNSLRNRAKDLQINVIEPDFTNIDKFVNALKKICV